MVSYRLFEYMKKRYTPSKGWLLDTDEILADSISALHAGGTIWEGKIEKPISRLSSIVFLMLIMSGMGYLVFRAETLQVSRGDQFYARSQENRFLTRSLFPPRGIFYDKNHKSLVENIPAFSMVFEKDLFLNVIATPQESSVPCAPNPAQSSEAYGRPSSYALPFAASADCARREKINSSQKLKDVISGLSKIMKKDDSFFMDAGFPKDYSLASVPGTLVISQDIPLAMAAEISARQIGRASCRERVCQYV